MKTIPLAVERPGDARFEADLALDISAFSFLNGTLLFWAVFAGGSFTGFPGLVLVANMILALGLALPCVSLRALFGGAAAPKLVLILSWGCIAVAVPHLSAALADDLPALFVTGAGLAGLTYIVAGMIALLSFEGEATIRIG